MKNSPYSENELLAIASGFKKHLKDHFATIKSACPGLDQDFIFRFKAHFYEAQAHPLEPETDSISKELELDLENLADQVRSLFLIIRFYIQKAFPYESKIWEAYGYCEIEKVIHDYSTLRKCLGGFVKLINEKRSELSAANCPIPTLDEMAGLSKQIGNKHEELLEHLERKEIRNEAYKTNLNELFKLMKMIHDAASKCFQNDQESLKQLTFPPKRPTPQN